MLMSAGCREKWTDRGQSPLVLAFLPDLEPDNFSRRPVVILIYSKRYARKRCAMFILLFKYVGLFFQEGAAGGPEALLFQC
jgi:hypothetical protein